MRWRVAIVPIIVRIVVLIVALSAVAVGLGACRRSAPPVEPQGEVELPTLNITHWTETTELFMEHPPLVAGRRALFAIHLTRLADFTAVPAGRATVEFTSEAGGPPIALVGPPPSRPGAFRVEDALPAAGRYRWAIVLDAPGLTDRHDLGSITVHPSVSAARAAVDEDRPAADASAVVYLKEQQWTNAFATVRVDEAEVRSSIRVPATIHPLPGGEAVVAAPAAGRFVADALPSIGDRVRPGQILGRLEPRLSTTVDRATLEADVAEARAAADAARTELERAERLLAERAVPARRVEDARRAATVVDVRVRAAVARLAQRDEVLRAGGGGAAGNTFVLRAPIAGRVVQVSATLGASYDEGAPLFRVMRTDRVELEVQVPTADVPAARAVFALSLHLPGVEPPYELEPDHVHDSGVVDPTTRALALQMEIPNPGERLLVGQAATAVLYGRGRQRGLVVPSSAVLTEAGRPFVFVQVGGERFARRFIDVVSRNGERVGVGNGLARGDRVVTTGAYDVQLASAASGLPSEGHVH